MNKNKLFALIAMVAMTCMVFGQGMSKSGMMMKKKPSAAWVKAHPRDPKTGKFIKRSSMMKTMPMRDSKGRFMKRPMMHSMPMHTMHPMHTMSSTHGMMNKPGMMKKPMAKKPGMMSRMKAIFHKKPSSN